MPLGQRASGVFDTSCVPLSNTPVPFLLSCMLCWLLPVFSLVLSRKYAYLQVIHFLALSLYTWNHNFHSALILQFFQLLCEATGHSGSCLCPILLHYLFILLLIGEGYHCGILPWKISWTEEPGGLQSLGSQRVTNTRLHLPLMDVGFCPCLLLQTVLQETPSCVFVACLSGSWSRLHLQGCDCRGTDGVSGSWSRLHLQGCDCRGTDGVSGSWSRAHLQGCDCRGTDGVCEHTFARCVSQGTLQRAEEPSSSRQKGIYYRSFAAMLAGLREQTLGWASRNDSQSHTKRLGHQKSCHLPLHQEVMFRTGKLPG